MKNVYLLFLVFICYYNSESQVLYGVSSGSGGVGTLSKYDVSTNTFTTEKFFKDFGTSPQTKLLLAKDGKFYGVTNAGGDFGLGVIFSFDPISSTRTDLHSFDGANGANPYGALMQASDGKLYGMTTAGGISNGYGGGNGVIFSLDITQTSPFYTVLHYFTYGEGSGAYSNNFFEASPGKLYGMTSGGGGIGYGTIFSLDISSTSPVYTILHSFSGTDGSYPYGSFISINNKLYATTSGGGTNNNGTVFSMDISTTTPSISLVYSFSAATGSNPQGSLLQASDGKVYGVCQRR